MLANLLGLGILFGVAALLLLVLLTWTTLRDLTRPPRRTLATALAHGRPGDPADLDLVSTSWMIERDGATLPVWDIEGADPVGVVAVFVHDWGSGRVEMLDHARVWAPWSRRMLLYDRRGHGDAHGGPSRLGAGEDEDLVEVVRGAGGDGPVVLVGDSMGAVIAIRAAARSDLVTGVIAFAPYLEVDDVMRRRCRRAGLPSWPFTSLALAWLRTATRSASTILDDVGSLPRRLLVVHGEFDEIVPAAEGRRVADAGGAPFMLVHGAAHGIPTGDETEAALEAFLRERGMIER